MPQQDLEEVAREVCAWKGYSFGAHVGGGAFKETFQVFVERDDPRALKVFRPGMSPERTEREIDAMMRCSHPNIARLSSVDRFDYRGTEYVVSLEEYLAGGTLTDHVRAGGLLPRSDATAIGDALISAIAHIASQDLVHRDVKPDNVIFRADGHTPVIVDFGLVRNLADVSLTQTWLAQGPGTPFFSPPEQLNNDKHLIDWRSDQFSLGVTLACCTFGYHPFGDPNTAPEETVRRVAARSGPTQGFICAANNAGLPLLVRMISPWPVERLRLPDELRRAWQLQSGVP